MPEFIRSLIVVLVFSVPSWYLAQQLRGTTFSPREFSILRICWFAITFAEFLAGNFIVFAVLVAGISFYARSARAPAIPVYLLLLLSVPLAAAEVETFGIVNQLLELNNARLLSIFLLIPALLGRDKSAAKGGYGIAELFFFLYVLLVIALQFRSSEATNVLRVAVITSLDIIVPYIAVSRLVTTPEDIRKVLLAVVIAAIPLSFNGIFETLKGWHLYSAAGEQIAGAGISYLDREGVLRANGPALSPIVFGYVLMIALGCLLALRPRIRPLFFFCTAGLVASTLLLTFSRGPWVGAAAMFAVYIATGPRAILNLALFGTGSVAALAAMALSPFGGKIVEMLPFIGTSASETVLYRQRLFEQSMIVIDRNFWFGSDDYRLTPELQELVQGEGFVDIVNHYVKIMLDTGVVGLTLFGLFFVVLMIGLLRAARRARPNDPLQQEMWIYTRITLAMIVAALVTIATASSIDFIPYIYWTLGGLGMAILRGKPAAIAQREAAVASGQGMLKPGLFS